MKKIIIFIVLALLLLLVGGCASNDATNDEKGDDKGTTETTDNSSKEIPLIPGNQTVCKFSDSTEETVITIDHDGKTVKKISSKTTMNYSDTVIAEMIYSSYQDSLEELASIPGFKIALRYANDKKTVIIEESYDFSVLDFLWFLEYTIIDYNTAFDSLYAKYYVDLLERDEFTCQ